MVRVAAQLSSVGMNPTEKEERGKGMEKKLLESFSSEYSTIAICRTAQALPAQVQRHIEWMSGRTRQSLESSAFPGSAWNEKLAG